MKTKLRSASPAWHWLLALSIFFATPSMGEGSKGQQKKAQPQKVEDTDIYYERTESFRWVGAKLKIKGGFRLKYPETEMFFSYGKASADPSTVNSIYWNGTVCRLTLRKDSPTFKAEEANKGDIPFYPGKAIVFSGPPSRTTLQKKYKGSHVVWDDFFHYHHEFEYFEFRTFTIPLKQPKDFVFSCTYDGRGDPSLSQLKDPLNGVFQFKEGPSVGKEVDPGLGNAMVLPGPDADGATY